MNNPTIRPETVELALREIAVARRHLQVASDALGALAATEALGESPPVAPVAIPSLEIAERTHDLLDIAVAIIDEVLPGKLAQRANLAGAKPRGWLYQVYEISIAPRGIGESVTTLVVMLAAVKFGLRHQLLLQTETRLGLQHKAPIPNHDLFLETFLSELMEADPGAVHFNAWLQQIVAEHYPDFDKSERLDLPNGAFLRIPDEIQPIGKLGAAPVATSALTSPLDPASAVLLPAGDGWRITLGYAEILYDKAYPAFNGKHHSGIDLYRWDARGKPVYAMRGGAVIDSVYLPNGFGNTVVIEHEDGTCLRYAHLENRLVEQGDRATRGQQIGTIGRGANEIYAAHLHLDMPRSSAHARASSYYGAAETVAERFLNPLSQIPASI